MYREIDHEDLILMIPLTEEEQRKVEYLDDTLTDGQWEVRDFTRDDAISVAMPGGDQVMLNQFIADAVVHLFQALDTVTQDEADQYAAEATDVEEVVTVGPETARAMLQRHMDENQWTEATLWHLVSEWLDGEEGRTASLSGFLNDVADTEREASLDG